MPLYLYWLLIFFIFGHSNINIKKMLLNQAFKGLNDWRRYVLGISIIIIGYFLGQIPLIATIYYKLYSNPQIGTEEYESFAKSMNFEAVGISKNLGFVLLILMFVIALIALWFVVKRLHKKRVIDLITPGRQINIQKILFGFGFWMILNLVIELINYWMNPGIYTFRWSGGAFFVLLFIAITLLPLQTSFEELFFRGYIMQGLAYFSNNKWIAILVSSILFGLIHGMNPEVEQYGFWTMQTYYITAGLFLAIITVMDDGLELALGVHAATNFFGATLLTYQGSVLQTDTLFITSEIKPWYMLLGFIVSSIIFIIVCTKKYQWPSLATLIKSDLYGINSQSEEL